MKETLGSDAWMKAHFYLCGPSGFVAGVRRELGEEAASRVFTEKLGPVL